MISFALKVLWFVLSVTGLIACWVVLVRFGRAVQWMIGPLLYCIGATLLNGVFALGMIWRMDPFAMPHTFCQVQPYIISFAAFLLTGCCAVCSVVTTRIVVEYSQGKTQLPTEFCRWKHLYIIPLIIFPCVASAVQISLSIRYDVIKPSDDLHCDATSPVSFRFLGYAGVPHLLTIPCFYWSLVSIMRFVRTRRHIIRSLPSSASTTTTIVVTNHISSISTDLRHHHDHREGITVSSPSTEEGVSVKQVGRMTLMKSEDRRGTTPLTRLPFLPIATPLTGAAPVETTAAVGDNDLSNEDDSSSFVGSHPLYLSPDSEEARTPVSTGHTLSPKHSSGHSSDHHDAGSIHAEDRTSDASMSSIATTSSLAWARPNTVNLDVLEDQFQPRSPQYCPTAPDEWHSRAAPSSHAHGQFLSPTAVTDERTCVEDDEDDDLYGRPQRKTRFDVMGNPIHNTTRRSRRTKTYPYLSPAILRLIIFQALFAATELLTSLSTIIDVATHRATPTPFGTQHVALLLSVWGPVLLILTPVTLLDRLLCVSSSCLTLRQRRRRRTSATGV